MTTIELILLLCILAATVGLVIYFEKNAAKETDGTVKLVEEKPLTKENIIKSLDRIGATDINADEDGIMFLYQNYGYWLCFKEKPLIAVAQVMKLSDDTNMRVIRQLIINANKEAIGWRLEMHEHDIAATSACFGLSCNDLEKFLPHLIYNDYNVLAHILREYELRQKPSN